MIRRLAWFSFSFAAGIFLAQYLLPAAALPLAAAGFALLALLGLLRRAERRLRILLAGFGLALAMLWNYAYICGVQAPAQALCGGEPGAAAAVVSDYAETLRSEAEESARFRIRVRLESGRRQIAAYLYGGEELLSLVPGNEVSAVFAVSDASRIDGKRVSVFTSKGVWLLLFPRGGLTAAPGDAGSVRYFPQRLARAVETELSTLYGGETAALSRALLTGDKSLLSDAAYSALSEAGLLHVAAVSGLHCMFLLALVELLAGKRRRLTAALALPLLCLYALMVGGTPSVVRAVTMSAFLLLAPIFRRENDPATALGAALLLILLANPFAAAGASLQLSFAAVAGILWLTPRLNRALTGCRPAGRIRGRFGQRLWRFVAANLSATLGALVFTIPLSAAYFDILVLIAPLSNLLCLPAASLLFCAALLSVGLGLLWAPLAVIPALAAKGAAAYFLWMARMLGRIPYHAVYLNNRYLVCWLAFAYALFGLCRLLRGGWRQQAAALLSGVLTLALCIALGRASYRYGQLQIVALDVGQGESVLLASGGKTALLDCGSSNRNISPGDTAADMLGTMGESALDYLILTHYHTDHTDGLSVLFSRVSVEKLIAPFPEDSAACAAVLRLAKQYGTEVEFLTREETLPLGEASLRLIAPLTESGEGNENESGLTILCSAGQFDFLMTGDMNGETEELLAETVRLPDLEVMMVGHHGSKYSSETDFLTAARAEVGIVSVGENEYGHPSDAALRRLAAAGMEIYRTDRQGSVRITVK